MPNGNIHYRRHVRNLTMNLGNPVLRGGETPRDQRSYSLSSDQSFYPPSPTPVMRRTSSRPGPGVQRNYQRAASWSQLPPDGVRRVREQYPEGNSLDLQLYTGLSNNTQTRAISQRHSVHGYTMPEEINGRSRTYSMSSMTSNESHDSSIGRSRQLYHPQNSMGSIHYHNRQYGSYPSRPHSDIYENGYQADEVRSVRSSRRSSIRSRPLSSPLPLQLGNPVSQYLTATPTVNHQQYPAQQERGRQKRVSRRSSYSKLLGIPSEEEKKIDGEGYNIANESFRNSTYGWDLPGMRLSMLNLAPENNESQILSADKEEPDERRKLNDMQYTTTLESTTRPYTPDKFLTARGHLKDLQPNKTNKSTSTGGTTSKSSKWRFGKGSPKAEENDLDLDLVPTLTDEEDSKTKREGKKLLKKFRLKTPRPSVDLDGAAEIPLEVRRGKSNTSFEGFFGKRSGGWREQEGAEGPEQAVEVDMVQPYTASTQAGPTTGLMKKANGTVTSPKDTIFAPDNEILSDTSPVVLISPADRLAAYFREKFVGLRKWRLRIITVTPKDIATAVTAEVVLTGHKRIPSRASTPVPRSVKRLSAANMAYSGPSSDIAVKYKDTRPANSPTASLTNLKKMFGLGTKDGWKLRGGRFKEKTSEKIAEINPDSGLARTRSTQTLASSFNIMAVPERISSPSGFEVVGGKGAGRAWGLEAPDVGTGGTGGVNEATSKASIPVDANGYPESSKHDLDGGQMSKVDHEKSQNKWRWLGGKTTANEKGKVEPLITRLRASISAGE